MILKKKSINMTKERSMNTRKMKKKKILMIMKIKVIDTR